MKNLDPHCGDSRDRVAGQRRLSQRETIRARTQLPPDEPRAGVAGGRRGRRDRRCSDRRRLLHGRGLLPARRVRRQGGGRLPLRSWLAGAGLRPAEAGACCARQRLQPDG